MQTTDWLKSELWKRFGSPEVAAEWDGKTYGGGKVSQRFWEYFKAIEYLAIDEGSVILDIGGGSPATGGGFFGALLAERAKAVVVIDPNAGKARARSNLEFLARSASYDELRDLLTARPDFTHIACISVLEHIGPEVRRGVMRAINEFFKGDCFVATFEFHARTAFFKHQLTTRTMSEMFEPLTALYLDRLESSPVLAENAFDSKRLMRLCRREPMAEGDIPRWYPVAVRFLRAQGAAPSSNHLL
jgi:2-polyprenyl-3-methyl-5-hydroxy-6-metoxy-1,4-benzoquinol methylase